MNAQGHTSGRRTRASVSVLAVAPSVLRLALVLGAPAGLGCASIPPGMAAVDGVSVQGNDAIGSSDIEDKLATTASPKFLFLFRGVVYDYELFDRNVLQRDLERVQRFYRARGYYEAIVRAGRVRYRGDKHVEVTIEVQEGKPVLVRDVRVEGLSELSGEDAAAVERVATGGMKKGAPFEEDAFLGMENAVKRALTDRARAWAKVERHADVDLPGHYASLSFVVRPGPKAVFGPVRVENLGELPEAPVRRAVDIAPGKPYSTAVLDSAQRAVLDLGTFSSVEIVPGLPEPPPPDGIVPLTVRVQPQKLKAVLVGGGIELDSIRTQGHLHVGWEHRNLFGGFRHFTVDAKPGADLYPTRLPTFQKPTRVLPEERVRAELRQPGFLEARTNGVVRSEINAYPLLLSPTVDPRAPVLGYVEYKGALGLDRVFWKLLGAPSYNLQWNKPFAYAGALDPDLRGLVLSYVDLLAHFDFRDDPLLPHAGVYLQNDLQVAGLGGAARDVRIQPEARGYIPLGRKVTLAGRATVGFLFPFNYGGAVDAATGGQVQGTSRAAWIEDIELIYLRGFFSGGPSSNRGYPLRGVGPHGVVPFFNPGLQARALAMACDVKDKNFDAARCAVPIGGLSLWEASIELRFPIGGPLSGTTFCDTSDVSAERGKLRLNYPHLSCGAGLRYATPIGPVRLDVGYRIPGAQVPKTANPLLEGQQSTVYGAPIAFAFGIGEAF